jgi:hypothetical protein
VKAHWDKVSQERNAQMESSCLSGGADQCRTNLAEIQRDLIELQGTGGDFNKGLSDFTPEERNNIKQVMAQTRTNLEVMAELGNQQLSVTYASPSELVAAGVLTEQEGQLLEAARAGSMVNFLGAVVLPSGVKANAVRTAGKTTQHEAAPAPGKAGGEPDTTKRGNNEASNRANADRLRMQLQVEEVAGTRLPSEITGYSKHGLNQAISRDGAGVAPGAILDAIKNPLNITGQSGGREVAPLV